MKLAFATSSDPLVPEANRDEQAVVTSEFETLSPAIQAAKTAQALERSHSGRSYRQLDISGLTDRLVSGIKRFHYNDIRGIECGLLSTATTLNLIFNHSARRACEAFTREDRELDYRIAFRAQSQYRATLVALAGIKNPSSVAFVNQANIAHGPQQVNNGGAPVNRSASKRKAKIRQSKLSGQR
jgi:hypothetical protein